MGRPALLATLGALALGLLPELNASARSSRPGDSLPWFQLKTMAGGRTVNNKTLRGKPFVLVIGRTQKAAPPCKRWVLGLKKRLPAIKVLQVIVVDKAWYIPRSLVLSKLRKFTPAAYRGDVLIEWYLTFARQFDIAKDDHPTVIVVDKAGRVRAHVKGALDAARLKRVLAAVKPFDGARHSAKAKDIR